MSQAEPHVALLTAMRAALMEAIDAPADVVPGLLGSSADAGFLGDSAPAELINLATQQPSNPATQQPSNPATQQPRNSATDEEPVSPRAAAANALNTLATQARDAYWEIDDCQGEAVCALLADICFYVVDPVLRDRMLSLAGECIEALEQAQGAAHWAAGTTERLQHRFEDAKPADDDAAAIARALGMTEEEAAAFGLTGHIATVDLDEDEVVSDEWLVVSDAASNAALEPVGAGDSLEDLFRRDARELVATTMPRALQGYWQNQASMDALLTVRRAFHTLKGDAAVTAQSAPEPAVADELAGLSRLAEAAEDIIDELLGDEREGVDPAPALPPGAFGLLSEAQAFLLRRLDARETAPGEADMLERLQAMQAKARALSRSQDEVVSDEWRVVSEDKPSLAVSQEPSARRDAGTPDPSLTTHHSPLTTHLLATFLSEADKLMPDLHRALARLSDEPSDENALVRARVKLHTLKGGAALAGPSATDIEQLAHNCEDVLELIEDYQLSGSLTTVPAAVLDCVLDAEDTLQSLLDGVRHAIEAPSGVSATSPASPASPDPGALIDRLKVVKERVMGGELPGSSTEPVQDHEQGAGRVAEALSAWVPEDQGHAAAQDPGSAVTLPARDHAAGEAGGSGAQPRRLAPLAALHEMGGQAPVAGRQKDGAPGTGQARAVAPAGQPGTLESAKEAGLQAALHALEDQQVSRDTLDLLLRDMAAQALESRRASARLRDLTERVERELAGLRLELVKSTRRSGDWDALEKEEYTAIDVLLMQLDEALADQQEADTLLRRDLAEARAQNEAQGDTLLQAQRSLLGMSMVPLSSLEARLDHAVRSVARRLNKAVVFHLEGGHVALESRIAEALFNPLMLLINNAIDHGVEERTADRTAAGKSAEGHITVRGRTDGDSVTIEIGDDGRGIDPDRIVAVAINRGLVDAGRAAAMTTQERIALIWQPGFSTARQVGAVSGRGMGMTSVLDDITALQGRIDVHSEAGKATSFTITLPRSLAMMRVHVIREGAHIVAVPIADLACTHAVRSDGIVAVPGGRAIRIGPRTLSVCAAHLSAGPEADYDAARGEWPVADDATSPVHHASRNAREGILLEVNGRDGGIVVDEVLYSQYLPVRPAPAYLRRSCGLIGYALGPGGIIMPILDMETIIARASPALAGRRAGSRQQAGGQQAEARRHTILVVDDSQTMRRALSQTFGKAGFTVREASNGREALTAVGRAMPDVITLDMEMPGMDGLETLTALRLLPGGVPVPVFMITSRQQARHRAAALAAGVTRYVTKPYDEDELVGAARLAIAGGLARTEVAS